ncbi:MAG: glycosyltransferase [Ignavibacteriales bacterium]|nr:glycosyltransferase [Ignavibacteriales bacterium]
MKESFPGITVVVPSMNQAGFLEAALDSILEQEYPNLELIVLDGGSDDGSREILERRADEFAFWRSEKDGGQYAAIEEGFARATGDVLTWLNADDLHFPGALQTVGSIFANRKDVEWIVGRNCLVNEFAGEGRMFPQRIWRRRDVLAGEWRWIPQESVFFRRSLYERAGGRMATELDYAADFELWLRFFRHAPLHTVRHIFAAMRNHAAQKTKAKERYEAEALAALERERERERREPIEDPPDPEPITVGVSDFRPTKTLDDGAAERERVARLAREGNFHEARIALLEYVSARPEEIEARTLYCELARMMGNHTAARVEYMNLQLCGADPAGAEAALIELEIADRRFPEAAFRLERRVAARPNDASSAKRLREVVEARDLLVAFEEAAQMEPTKARSRIRTAALNVSADNPIVFPGGAPEVYERGNLAEETRRIAELLSRSRAGDALTMARREAAALRTENDEK